MTLGHLDLIDGLVVCLDRLYVGGIFFNHEKKGHFTAGVCRGHGEYVMVTVQIM